MCLSDSEQEIKSNVKLTCQTNFILFVSGLLEYARFQINWLSYVAAIHGSIVLADYQKAISTTVG